MNVPVEGRSFLPLGRLCRVGRRVAALRSSRRGRVDQGPVKYRAVFPSVARVTVARVDVGTHLTAKHLCQRCHPLLLLNAHNST